MSDKTIRLSKAARDLNLGTHTLVESLAKHGHHVENNPNAKISEDQFALLAKEFKASALEREVADSLTIGKNRTDNVVIQKGEKEQEEVRKDEEQEIRIVDLSSKSISDASSDKSQERIVAKGDKLEGLKVVGKIELGKPAKQEATAPTTKAAPAETKVETVKETVKPEPKKEEVAPVQAKEQVVSEAPKPSEKPEVVEKPKPAKKAEVVAKEVVKEPVKELVKETPTPVVAEKPTSPVETAPLEEVKSETIKAKAETLQGLTVLGKITLPTEKPKGAKSPVASSDAAARDKNKKKARKRITTVAKESDKRGRFNKDAAKKPGAPATPATKEEPTEKEIQEQIRQTLARLSGGDKSNKGNRSKYRREKRQTQADQRTRDARDSDESKILKVTEFVSANDLSSLMNVSVNEVISVCLSLGMFVSINQRLDAESITIIADEFGYEVKFTSAEDEILTKEVDREEDLSFRAPIVTIMGHVDHGKTSLLDYIRDAKVAASESGGITQHIGAYDVTTNSGKRIAFLDTPGHEAFTAMRARGAKVTDVVIVVIAADDAVMPQTKEAINHAMVAGVPIVFAFNKIDKPNANSDRIREQLSAMNILVEDWGGKYQSQEISAKSGLGVDELLEKVLLEAELLDLKANPNKKASGAVIEASLDKGRGYVSTVLVQDGTLSVGDIILAGANHGRVKAMFNHRGQKLKTVGPSTPVQILGFNGAPSAGDTINVLETEREAREIANRREQIQREQNIRTKKHITLDEIGRRLAIGSFKQLNVLVKGDVDGSVEALSDSLLKLSTPEVQVAIIYKAVGQISESDVLLASASDAIIVGFQVRPSANARKLAETEEIEIRLYSIIYDAINEVKDAMEGMLAPTEEEVITGTIEVREVFKISKIGTVAGCYVTDGFVKRNNKVRLIRDGIVVYTGDISALKRFKDDVSEVKQSYECGLSIKNFNDIREGDNIEGFEMKEVKRTL